MNTILFLSMLLISFKISNQQNRTERINEGASTSRQDLMNCEKRELRNGAIRTISLMLAKDPRGENLTSLINNRFEELQAFSDEIFSYVIQAQNSVSEISNKTRQYYRLDYFTTHLFKEVLMILQKACSDHHRYKLWYEYDSRRKIILIHEYISTVHNNNSNDCLCGNYQERDILSEPFLLPSISYFDEAYQIDISIDGEVSMIKTSPYHVIPLRLILKFFETWLTRPTDNAMNECMGFNNCAHTLYLRLRQSMRKLVIARMLQMNKITQNDYVNIGLGDSDEIYIELISNAGSYLGGNIFLGPRFRGPLDPTFDEENLLNAFEIDSAPIIGQDRYNELLQLFHQLKFFTNRMLDRPPFWRLISGFKLFVKISNLLMDQSITPLRLQMWELRAPTDEELRRHMDSDELMESLKNQTYWAVKKPMNRSARSTDVFQTKAVTLKNLMIDQTSYHWSEFTVDLMTILMEARERKEFLVWSCNFTRLFNDYLFSNPQPVKNDFTDCPISSSFDEYLYSQISESEDWVRCNRGTKISSDWCSAWRRIIKSEAEVKVNINYDKKNLIDNAKLMEDIKIFMHWLISKIHDKQCQKNEPTQVNIQINPSKNLWRSSYNILDNDLFYLKKMLSSLRFREKNRYIVFGFVIKTGN